MFIWVFYRLIEKVKDDGFNNIINEGNLIDKKINL